MNPIWQRINIEFSGQDVKDMSHSDQGKASFVVPKRFLRDGYVLNENDVYCGRGYLCFNHVGNHRFRDLVSANIQRYNNSLTKFQKSLIIQEVVDYVRSMSEEGGFVKKDIVTGRYFEVGDYHAVRSIHLFFVQSLIRSKSSNTHLSYCLLFLSAREDVTSISECIMWEV
jgi:hypothetical protein